MISTERQESTLNKLVLKIQQVKKKKKHFLRSKTELWTLCLPDYLYQLTHVNMVRDKELCLVQDGKLLFPLISLNDHL